MTVMTPFKIIFFDSKIVNKLVSKIVTFSAHLAAQFSFEAPKSGHFFGQISHCEKANSSNSNSLFLIYIIHGLENMAVWFIQGRS